VSVRTLCTCKRSALCIVRALLEAAAYASGDHRRCHGTGFKLASLVVWLLAHCLVHGKVFWIACVATVTLVDLPSVSVVVFLGDWGAQALLAVHRRCIVARKLPLQPAVP
jgi:hypothetical protein